MNGAIMNAPTYKMGKTEVRKTSGGELSKNVRSAAPNFEKIQNRAETITPVLRQILEYRPAPHWGVSD
jgi:hypothetical protein